MTSGHGHTAVTAAGPRVPGLEVPAGLARDVEGDAEDGAARRAWLDALPRFVADLADCWSLRVGRPFEPGGSASWVAPARTAAGQRLVPGSHHPEQNTRLAGYSRRRGLARGDAAVAAYQASFPGYAAETVPGDVIAFDLHTWHASIGGRDRLAWTAVYQRCPETEPERDRTLRSVHDSFEQAFRGFDTGRYPVWRDWLADASAHSRRAGVIERMRHAGVLDLPGARDGW